MNGERHRREGIAKATLDQADGQMRNVYPDPLPP